MRHIDGMLDQKLSKFTNKRVEEIVLNVQLNVDEQEELCK